MPTLGEDGLEPPPPGSPRPIYRDYTVRFLRPERRELDIDFALHGHGPGATWAEHAAPGQRLGILAATAPADLRPAPIGTGCDFVQQPAFALAGRSRHQH